MTIMSTFENNDYKWHETYFVLFDSSRRPTLDQVKRSLADLNSRFVLSEGEADDNGKFDSSDRPKFEKLIRANAKFDVLHFEQVGENEADDEGEMLDPSALLSVMD